MRIGVGDEPVELAVVARLGIPLPQLGAELGEIVRRLCGPVPVEVIVFRRGRRARHGHRLIPPTGRAPSHRPVSPRLEGTAGRALPALRPGSLRIGTPPTVSTCAPVHARD